ncbi:M48 family metallopeptidase [Vibrio japonicus]|uniref:M48 family metallopeptidase n=1 Tax=Vibrio japonicus TaxID=1824638 RepID=A0ABY5LFX1_9VIBR|nr:M48 family metallopeptidase [Vibrio japonicus]UUM30943.1 M48 family metallopeptidase [Vibrio japonicus]
MRFLGVAFPPKSSLRYEAELDTTQANVLSLRVDGMIFSCDLMRAEISIPVGNLPIRIKLPDGWVFVVERSPELSQWLKSQRKIGWLDKLESNLFGWLISIVVCIAVIIGGYTHALPWVSEKVVLALPDAVAVELGEQTLEMLSSASEEWRDSELPEAQQAAIRQRVKSNLTSLEPLPYPVEIVFRSSTMGANAFALPGGKVVLLDELVQLAKTPQQLDSIILHEIGHIHHRHMMKRLVHSSILSVGVALLTGESSGVIDNLAGLGVFFLSAGHSRDAENEADLFAKQAMLTIYGTSEPMAEMFELFHQQESIEIPKWLSSHPDFDQRIQAARD